MADLRNTNAGILNTFEYNNRKPISLRYDNSFSTIRGIVAENAAPSILPHVHNYIGEVLFVFPEGATANDSLWSSLQSLSISEKPKIQIIARIPEIHATIPVPKSSDDFGIISLYPTYTAIDNNLDRPEVGDLVLLDYKDKQSFANPIYLGKLDDQQRNISKNSTGVSSRSAFSAGQNYSIGNSIFEVAYNKIVATTLNEQDSSKAKSLLSENKSSKNYFQSYWRGNCLEFADSLLAIVLNRNRPLRRAVAANGPSLQNWRGQTLSEAVGIPVGAAVHVKMSLEKTKIYDPVDDFHHWVIHLGNGQYSDSKSFSRTGQEVDSWLQSWVKGSFSKSKYQHLHKEPYKIQGSLKPIPHLQPRIADVFVFATEDYFTQNSISIDSTFKASLIGESEKETSPDIEE